MKKMKKIFLLSCLAITFLSCKKESTPFEASIEKYVQSNFHDPSSYEKISIEVLDTVTVAKKIATYKERGASTEQFDNEPKDKFLYYTVSHKYRANNKMGALTVHDDIVSMDKDYNITGTHGVNK